LTSSYKITAKDTEGNDVKDGFKVRITLPFSGIQKDKASQYKVVYWDGFGWSSNGITNIVADDANSTVSFDTVHFTEFAVVYPEDGNLGLINTLPRTGSSQVMYLFVNLLISLIFTTIFVRVIRRSRFSNMVN
jgi:hypothetical protein